MGQGGSKGFRMGLGIQKGIRSRRGLGVYEGPRGSGRGYSLRKIHMFAIMQNNFSFTHKECSCVLNKSLRGTE